MRTLTILLLMVAFSCTIIPDDALDHVPSKARLASIDILELDRDTDTRKPAGTATVKYEGPVTDPTKIEVTWALPNKLMRVPVFDRTNAVAKTTYELSSGRVTKITNVNSDGMTARVETFTHNGDKLSKVVQENYENGEVKNTLTSDFFYSGSEIDSIAQEACFPGGSCWPGFIVALTQDRVDSRAFDLATTCENGGSDGMANFFSVFPYDEGYSYRYENDPPQYTINDYNKSLYRLPIGDDAFISTAVISQAADYSEADCRMANFLSNYQLYSGPHHIEIFMGFYEEVMVEWNNDYDAYMDPLYYRILPGLDPINDFDYSQFYQVNHLLTEVNIVSILSRRLDWLYEREVNDFERKEFPTYMLLKYNFDAEK